MVNEKPVSPLSRVTETACAVLAVVPACTVPIATWRTPSVAAFPASTQSPTDGSQVFPRSHA